MEDQKIVDLYWTRQENAISETDKKIARNLALNRYDYNHAKKRHTESAVILDEFWECVTTPTPSFEENLTLKQAINDFLGALEQPQRIIFLQRYWYFCSIKEIAENTKLTQSNIKTSLHRLRKQFKEYLEKEGIVI